MWKKIVIWFQRVFKKTTFDNKLFKIGIDAIVKLIIKEIEDVNVKNEIDEIELFIMKVLKQKFRNIPVVKIVLKDIVQWTFNLLSVKIEFIDAGVENKIKIIGKTLTKWYDNHL